MSESLTFENSTYLHEKDQNLTGEVKRKENPKFLFTFCLYYIHLLFFISAHSMDLDPFVRSTFWMVSTGLTTMWVANVGA